MSDRYRRSPHLVCYWRRGELIIENYARHSRVVATPLAFDLLHFFSRWRSASAVAQPFANHDATSLARAVTDLIRFGLLERSSAPRDPHADALRAWETWSPAASFFHFSTKDAHTPIDRAAYLRKLRGRARRQPLPAPIKRYPAAPQVSLPLPESAGELPRVLLERRTWRQFGRRPIDLGALATLLGLCFGVQWWLDIDGIGRTALKTSPSGGSRHPIEAYVLAPRVRGLRRGLYHYEAGSHRLELLRDGASPTEITRYLNGQRWFSGASALVLMTAVFARTQWKYPGPRAYRVPLIEAGHVCQTFCLLATSMGLAPFCTMALADSKIESALGIDGVSESILYTAGVGARPTGMDWAPWESRPYGRRVRNLPHQQSVQVAWQEVS